MGAYFPGCPRDEFSHPLVARYALKSGRVPHSGVFASGEASVCTPLANNGLGLGSSSSSGPVASRPPLVDRSASAASLWFLSPGCFMRWSYPHGGSLAALPEVGLLGKGCWRIVRVLQILCLTPLPGVRSRLLFLASRYGRCSRQRHLHVAWNPPLSRARYCLSLPLRVATLSLKLSRSEVPGPHVLLSNYVARIISCGPGVLSSFCHPSWVVSLVLQNLIGAPPDIRRAFFWFWKRSSSWPLPRLGILGCSMLCFFVALFPGAGVRCPFLSSRASWQRLRSPPPLLLGLRASLYRPNQTRDNRNGRLLYPVQAVRCYLVRLGCALSALRAVPFCCRV